MVYPISRVLLLPFIRLFIKETNGLENVPKKGPFIIACKHLASLDGMFIASVLVPYIGEKIYYVATVADWGWYWDKIVSQQWAGCIPFYKENPHACLHIADDYLKKGRVVGIFPEGRIELRRKKEYKPKTGTARLAIWNKVPILPIGLAHNITIKDKESMHLRRNMIKNIFKHPNSLTINIGKMFDLSEYYDSEMTKEMLLEASEKVMDHIEPLSSVNGGKAY